MANKTRHSAQQIHGTNPQFLIEKVTRSRIYDSVYWKEHCFALTAETLIDKALGLEYVGGLYGVQKPCPFLCLVLKLLQIQPEKEILLEYLKVKEFKYLRALAAFYVRLTFRPVEVYEVLEPLLEDYRKLRFRRIDGAYHLSHMDEFVDELLIQERVCNIVLPRMTRRDVLEETEGLVPRASQLEDALLAFDEDDEGKEDESAKKRRHKWMEKLQKRRVLPGRKDISAPTSPIAGSAASVGSRGDDDSYLSQEFSDDDDDDQPRYLSRSTSNTTSLSSSRSDDAPRPARSPSPRSDFSAGDRYVSRSPSRSPERG